MSPPITTIPALPPKLLIVLHQVSLLQRFIQKYLKGRRRNAAELLSGSRVKPFYFYDCRITPTKSDIK